MAGELIGRAACPECDFESAHIKRSAKCVYRWCPECGATYHATGEARAARLLAKMRPEGAARPGIQAPAAAPAPVAPQSAPTPTPTQEKVPAKPRAFCDI